MTAAVEGTRPATRREAGRAGRRAVPDPQGSAPDADHEAGTDVSQMTRRGAARPERGVRYARRRGGLPVLRVACRGNGAACKRLRRRGVVRGPGTGTGCDGSARRRPGRIPFLWAPKSTSSPGPRRAGAARNVTERGRLRHWADGVRRRRRLRSTPGCDGSSSGPSWRRRRGLPRRVAAERLRADDGRALMVDADRVRRSSACSSRTARSSLAMEIGGLDDLSAFAARIAALVEP